MIPNGLMIYLCNIMINIVCVFNVYHGWVGVHHGPSMVVTVGGPPKMDGLTNAYGSPGSLVKTHQHSLVLMLPPKYGMVLNHPQNDPNDSSIQFRLDSSLESSVCIPILLPPARASLSPSTSFPSMPSLAGAAGAAGGMWIHPGSCLEIPHGQVR